MKKPISLFIFALSVSLYALPADYFPVERTDLYLFLEGIFYITDSGEIRISDIHYEDNEYFVKKYVDNAPAVGAESGEKVNSLFKRRRK
jgi:hypothetical protein